VKAREVGATGEWQAKVKNTWLWFVFAQLEDDRTSLGLSLWAGGGRERAKQEEKDREG
jgi:hypothetical protein